jgi:hypothetical protein
LPWKTPVLIGAFGCKSLYSGAKSNAAILSLIAQHMPPRSQRAYFGLSIERCEMAIRHFALAVQSSSRMGTNPFKSVYPLSRCTVKLKGSFHMRVSIEKRRMNIKVNQFQFSIGLAENQSIR